MNITNDNISTATNLSLFLVSSGVSFFQGCFYHLNNGSTSCTVKLIDWIGVLRHFQRHALWSQYAISTFYNFTSLHKYYVLDTEYKVILYMKLVTAKKNVIKLTWQTPKKLHSQMQWSLTTITMQKFSSKQQMTNNNRKIYPLIWDSLTLYNKWWESTIQSNCRSTYIYDLEWRGIDTLSLLHNSASDLLQEVIATKFIFQGQAHHA